jgi:hypothetical protein
MTLLGVGLALGTAGAASAKSWYFYSPFTKDATYHYNQGVIAGVTPDFYSTFIRGQRCHYEYRVQYGERIRITVCN